MQHEFRAGAREDFAQLGAVFEAAAPGDASARGRVMHEHDAAKFPRAEIREQIRERRELRGAEASGGEVRRGGDGGVEADQRDGPAHTQAGEGRSARSARI